MDRCVLCDWPVEWDDEKAAYVAIAPFSPDDRSSRCPDASGPYDPAHVVHKARQR